MLTPQEQEFFSQLVYIHNDIDLRIDKMYLFKNRLDEVVKILDYKNLLELCQCAKTNLTNELRDMIIEAMNTNKILSFKVQFLFANLKLS